MNSQLWSIYKSAQIEIEGSEAWQLAQVFPHAACHDGTNTVFVASLDNPENAFVLPSFEYVDQMALAAGQFLYADSPHALQLKKGQALALFKHQMHRLWCGNYAERTLFESDYAYTSALLGNSLPALVGDEEFTIGRTLIGAVLESMQ